VQSSERFPTDVDPDELLNAIVDDLRGYARRMVYYNAGLTLQPTELVTEAFLKLYGTSGLASVKTQEDVFRLYVRAMKSVLIDYLRAKKTLKSGGNYRQLAVEGILTRLEDAQVDPTQFIDLLDELDAMKKPRLADVVLGRIVMNLTNQEIAANLQVSVATVESDLRTARIWLKDRLGVQ